MLAEICARTKKTTLMVTHDVDESVYLSDRVAMMTTGPSATLGEIVEIPFARPRDRRTVLEDSAFDRLRTRILTFLEQQAHQPNPGAGPSLAPATSLLVTQAL